MTLTDLLPQSSRGAVAYTFDCMGVAEELIKATFRGREPRDRPYSVFLALCPTDPLKGKALELYRAHAAELCARMKAGKPLDPATDAELLAVVSDTSLIAPLNNSGAALVQHLFAEVFPTSAVFEGAPREQWKGKLEEDMTTLRKRFTVKNRGVPE